MRTIDMWKVLLAGLLIVGSTGAAAAPKGKADPQREIPVCGKDTKVAKPNDDMIYTLKEKKRRGCVIDIKALHPTQSAVGMLAAACKSAKVSARAAAGELNDYLLADNRWVPVVRGPGGVFYLTDHHHLTVAVWNAAIDDKDKKVYAYLLDDWSRLPENAFWERMEKTHRTWLKDPAGKSIVPNQLPSEIGKLQDDPLRTLSAWVRENCGYVKCDPPGAAKNDDEQSCADRTCEEKFGSKKVPCANAYFIEFAWGAYQGEVPEVKAALGDDAACPQQNPMNQACLDRQYDKLLKALPAAMEATAAIEAKMAVEKLARGKDTGGESRVSVSVGHNPKVQTPLLPPRCVVGDGR